MGADGVCLVCFTDPSFLGKRQQAGNDNAIAAQHGQHALFGYERGATCHTTRILYPNAPWIVEQTGTKTWFRERKTFVKHARSVDQSIGPTHTCHIQRIIIEQRRRILFSQVFVVGDGDAVYCCTNNLSVPFEHWTRGKGKIHEPRNTKTLRCCGESPHQQHRRRSNTQKQPEGEVATRISQPQPQALLTPANLVLWSDPVASFTVSNNAISSGENSSAGFDTIHNTHKQWKPRDRGGLVEGWPSRTLLLAMYGEVIKISKILRY